MEIYWESSDSVTLMIYSNGVPTNADSAPLVTITRLSDDSVIVNNQGATYTGTTGKYKYTLTSSQNSSLGRFRVNWSFTVSGAAATKTDYYEVVVGYTNPTQVREHFPDLESKTNDEIYLKEKLARRIIDVYCNQSFGFTDEETRIIRGKNESRLYLDARLFNLTRVLVDGVDDVTSEVEIYDDYWLSHISEFYPGDYSDVKKGLTEPSRYFRRTNKYHIKGDWGWESVPENINLAAIMLINDYFCDTSLLRQHGILSYQLGEKDLTIRRDLWGTTGNYDVDQLLADYVFVGVELI